MESIQQRLSGCIPDRTPLPGGVKTYRVAKGNDVFEFFGSVSDFHDLSFASQLCVNSENSGEVR